MVYSCIRKHNRVRVALHYAEKKRATARAEKSFRSDPFRYNKNLFNPPNANGSPAFSKEEAESYFPPLYRDSERDYLYEPLENLKRPAAPKFLFDVSHPTVKDLANSARKKKNGASAGING